MVVESKEPVEFGKGRDVAGSQAAGDAESGRNRPRRGEERREVERDLDA
jgi:hypothetical protein